jgi:hypothetical protein
VSDGNIILLALLLPLLPAVLAPVLKGQLFAICWKSTLSAPNEAHLAIAAEGVAGAPGGGRGADMQPDGVAGAKQEGRSPKSIASADIAETEWLSDTWLRLLWLLFVLGVFGLGASKATFGGCDTRI